MRGKAPDGQEKNRTRQYHARIKHRGDLFCEAANANSVAYGIPRSLPSVAPSCREHSVAVLRMSTVIRSTGEFTLSPLRPSVSDGQLPDGHFLAPLLLAVGLSYPSTSPVGLCDAGSTDHASDSTTNFWGFGYGNS